MHLSLYLPPLWGFVSVLFICFAFFFFLNSRYKWNLFNIFFPYAFHPFLTHSSRLLSCYTMEMDLAKGQEYFSIPRSSEFFDYTSPFNHSLDTFTSFVCLFVSLVPCSAFLYVFLSPFPLLLVSIHFFKILIKFCQPDEMKPFLTLHFQVDSTPSSCTPTVLVKSSFMAASTLCALFVTIVPLPLPGGRSLRRRLGSYVSHITHLAGTEIFQQIVTENCRLYISPYSHSPLSTWG